MYMPMSLEKDKYNKEQAIAEYEKNFIKGNVAIFASVGLKFDPINIVVKEDDKYFTVALDQGNKYDMTDAARKLFLAFFSQISEDFSNKKVEERKEFV